jgi:hypothetical protein
VSALRWEGIEQQHDLLDGLAALRHRKTFCVSLQDEGTSS